MASPGTLQPLPLPDQVWKEVTMDFIVQLPKSKGKTTIMVVVDRLSKYAHFCALPPGFNAESVAATFIQEVCRLHGVPASVVSDRDPIFMSRFWQELFKRQGTMLSHSTAYHPQSDGQTEVLNRVLEDYLRCYVDENQSNWAELLPWAELHYNTTVHSGLGMSPFEAVYGRSPPILLDYVAGTSKVGAVDEMLVERKELINQLRNNLERAQHRMVQQANRHRSEVEYSVGDWVFVRLRPYRQMSVHVRRSNKLAKRYYGPFKILERIGRVTYRLALLEESKIHNVFHVSLLKRCRATPPFQQVVWPSELTGGPQPLLPEKVLDRRMLQQGRKRVTEILVKWSGLDETEATWENLAQFNNDYPTFGLEDEELLQGGVMMRRLGLDAEKDQGVIQKRNMSWL